MLPSSTTHKSNASFKPSVPPSVFRGSDGGSTQGHAIGNTSHDPYRPNGAQRNNTLPPICELTDVYRVQNRQSSMNMHNTPTHDTALTVSEHRHKSHAQDRPQHADSLPPRLQSHVIHAPKPSPPLSIYESPTATYMWPRFDPTFQPEKKDSPILFVKYKPFPRAVSETVQADSSSGALVERPISPRPTRLVTPDWTSDSRKRSSSPESEVSRASPSDRFLKHPRFSRYHQTSHGVDPRHTQGCSTAGGPTQPTFGGDRMLQANFNDLDLESESSDEETLQDSREGSTYGSTSHAVKAPIRMSYADVPRDIATNAAPPSLDRDKWQQYAQPPHGSDTTFYSCSWPNRDADGRIIPCGYSSKRHLVKRHIESKHLQFRPCKCPHEGCDKSFSQKSNLETHMNTHTGAAPHGCLYCDQHFSDPARRHRHMQRKHGHVSSRTKKNRKNLTALTPEMSD
ncbi:hypothetical protein B0H21DRAFT_717088 [Amylocystis lapponica]|nr:hypothetical protein B0H21DRAFT_717088 [Amylocystis lapponica]